MVAKRRKEDSMDLGKTVHYSQHSKQQEHLHGCAGSSVANAPCPKGMMQWILAVDCGAREEPSAQGSEPVIASSKQTGSLLPGSKQSHGSQAAAALTNFIAMCLATEMAQGQKMDRPYGWHTQ